MESLQEKEGRVKPGEQGWEEKGGRQRRQKGRETETQKQKVKGIPEKDSKYRATNHPGLPGTKRAHRRWDF